MSLSSKALLSLQIIFVVCPAFTVFGYTQVGVGGLLSFASWISLFHEIDTTNTTGAVKSHNALIQGVYVASYTLGSLVGALSCFSMGDRLGRRLPIMIASATTAIGTVLSCSAYSLAQLTIGRVITGMGTGMVIVIVPIWQAECSPPANRGMNVVVDGLFITMGFALSSWVNYGFSHMDSSPVSWRLSLAIPGILSLFPLAVILFLPESPRWLVGVGSRDQASKELARIKGYELDDSRIIEEISEIELSLEETSGQALSIRDIFTMQDGKLFYRFMLCILLQLLQQMSGANAITTYSQTIFEKNLGLSADKTRILASCLLTWKFISTPIAFFTIDRFGRRMLFIVCGAGMSLSILCTAITTSFPVGNKAAAAVSVTAIFIYCFFFPIAFVAANFLYCTEIAPARLRVKMTSISTANLYIW